MSWASWVISGTTERGNKFYAQQCHVVRTVCLFIWWLAVVLDILISFKTTFV